MPFESELASHYAEVRKRLGAGPVPPKPVVIPKPVVALPKPAEPPRTYFDASKLYRLAFDSSQQKPDLIKIEKIEAQKSILGKVTFKDVLNAVAAETGLTPEEIISKRRKRDLIMPRRYFFWRVAKECPHLSLAEIGRRAGVDHTTVLYHIHKYSVDSGEKVENMENVRSDGRTTRIGMGRLPPGYSLPVRR